MAAPSFSLMTMGRGKLAAAAGSSPSQQSLTRARFRIVQQVFNDRRLVCRNRVVSNRHNLLLSAIEHEHNREQVTQRLQRQSVLTDLKKKDSKVDSYLTLLPSYEPIDLTEPKSFYRFGVRVQSAGPHIRSRVPKVRSNVVGLTSNSTQSRAKSASTLSRPYTAPLQIFRHDDIGSDDEKKTISVSRMTSEKRSTSAVSNSVLSYTSPESNINNTDIISSSTSHRITWPVKLKVFALQDEDEARKQYLDWRNEQRKTKTRRSSKEFYDIELERKYQASIRRRKEIEAFITPDIIEEHKLNDPVFAKRYQQLKLACQTGRIPAYDLNDRDMNVTMTKSKIQRARTALITAKQSKMKDFYQNQQTTNEANLSKRIDTFLKRLAILKEEQELHI